MTIGRRVGAAATAMALAMSMPASARADDPVAQPPSDPLTGLPEEPSPTPTPTPTAPPPPVAVEPNQPVDGQPLETPDRKKREVGFAGRVHGGLGQRSLFESSVLGADLNGSLGLYVDNVNIYADLQLLFASTEGLPVRQYRFGPSVELEPTSRIHLGAGLSIGGTTVTRETNGQTLSALSIGIRIFASVDVVKTSDRSALYLLGQLSVDSAGEFLGSDSRKSVPSTLLWGPTIAVGYRF